MRDRDEARRRMALDLRDRLRTNRQADGSLSAKDVDALLDDCAHALGEDADPPRADTGGQAAPPSVPGPGGPSSPHPSGNSADPGRGVDLTPGRDVLPGTPLSEGENPNLPTGGPVGDNVPGPAEGKQDNTNPIAPVAGRPDAGQPSASGQAPAVGRPTVPTASAPRGGKR